MKYFFIILITLFFCFNFYSNEKENIHFKDKFSFIYTSNENDKNSDNEKNYIPFLMFGLPGITGGLSLTSAIILTVFYSTKYMYDGILAGMIVSWVIFGLASLTIIIESILVFFVFFAIIKSFESIFKKDSLIYLGDNYLGIKIKIPSYKIHKNSCY